CAPGRLQLW
nr:immunoglobulin heavy chain junction region [Homo sapiens]MOP70987.1 immunoglobulin heavy chain junction region [Homo sapiens]